MILKFKVNCYEGSARTGVAEVRGKKFRTPAFLPVATLASVRALDFRDLKELGVEIIMANTFHLHLKPGDELIKELGGLHKFMNFNGVIATDSGEFRFSLLALEWSMGLGR